MQMIFKLINNTVNYLWAIGNDLPNISNTRIVRPYSTQSYSDSDTSNNNTDYFDTWSENDSGYDSDPFIALFLAANTLFSSKQI